MALAEIYLYCEKLKMEIPVSVVVPQPAFDGEKFKVFWMYHGATGDHTAWLRMTRAEYLARKYHVALVVPTVHKSMFTNMVHGEPWGDYVGEELVWSLRRLFPCFSDKREDNYVCGLSNGAYGALRVGLRYPELYCAIGAFSGGDSGDRVYHDDGTYRAHRHVLVYGEGYCGQSEHSVRYLAAELARRGGPFPRIYHTSGEKEGGPENIGMTDFFGSFDGDPYAGYRFEVIPGYGHEWPTWDASFEKFLGEYLKLPSVPVAY